MTIICKMEVNTNPYYNGTVLDYLEQHPDKHYFSDLVRNDPLCRNGFRIPKW